MKLRIETSTLARALYRVQGIADKKSSTPALAHVLLSANDQAESKSALSVAATDLDVGLRGDYEAEVLTGGSATVNAKQLYDIVKSLPTEHLEFESHDNHWVEITAGQSQFRLVGGAADDFPALPDPASTELFDIDSKSFQTMIERTLFCVSTDDNRHNLSGIYCETPEPGLLRMVSTDGHRLAMSEQHFEGISLPGGLIVPRKGFQELKRILSDNSTPIDTIQIGFTQNSGVIRAGSVTLTTRLVEGQFPDYSQVVPKQFSKVVRIPRVPFGDSLRRVSLLSQGKAHGVRLKFSNGTVEISAEDPQFGDAREALEASYEGETLLIGFNARYILDVLPLLGSDLVTLQLTDDLSPGVIRPEDENEGFLSVIMPMRI